MYMCYTLLTTISSTKSVDHTLSDWLRGLLPYRCALVYFHRLASCKWNRV